MPVRVRQPNEPSRDVRTHHSRWFWLLTCITGVASGLAGVALLELLHAVQRVAWTAATPFLAAVRATSAVHRVAVLTAAGVLVATAGVLLRRRGASHSGGLTHTIWFHSGRFPPFRTMANAVLSIVVVAMGASLGREGALKEAGATIASALSVWRKLPSPEQRLLAACGAAGGFAAAYNLPFGGALFALEVLLGTLTLELAGPVMLASVIATAVSRAFLGSAPTYPIPIEPVTAAELVWSAGAGPLLGIASVLFVRGFDRLDAMKASGIRERLLPIVILAGLGAVSIAFPELLGNGKDTVHEALLGNVPLSLLAVLPALKFLAIGLCAGAGVPGGLFTPTLCVGSLLGGLLGVAWQLWWPGAWSGAYALIGMTALLSGTTHGPVSSVVLVLELTGNVHLLPALVLVSATSVAVSRYLEPRTVYTARLQRHMRSALTPPPTRPSGDLEAVLTGSFERLPSASRWAVVTGRLLRLRAGTDLYVVDDAGRLVGRVTPEAIEAAARRGTSRANLVAADLTERVGDLLRSDATSVEIGARLRASASGRIPVVDTEGRLVGVAVRPGIAAAPRPALVSPSDSSPLHRP